MTDTEPKILRNSGRCLHCADEIVSTFTHDYVACSCGAVFVDGGRSYLRRGGDMDAFEDTSIVEPESSQARRERAVREVEQANGGELPVHSLLDWELANPVDEPNWDGVGQIDRDRIVADMIGLGAAPEVAQRLADQVLVYLREDRS